MRVKSRLAAALLGALTIGAAVPGTGVAAPYPSTLLEVCNNYTDSDYITIKITGSNHNNVQVSTPRLSIDRGICAVIRNVPVGNDRIDYWWRTDAVIEISNSRCVRVSSSRCYTEIKNTRFRSPSSAPDGSIQRATLPAQRRGL